VRWRWCEINRRNSLWGLRSFRPGAYLPAAVSPIHFGRQTVDSSEGKGVQHGLDQSSAVTHQQMETAVVADPLVSSPWPVQKMRDSKLKQPALDGDTPLVIHTASDIESHMDDAVRRVSASKTRRAVRVGTGPMPAGASSRKQRSPNGRPAPQHGLRHQPYPEDCSKNNGPSRLNSPAYQRTWSHGRSESCGQNTKF